MSLPFPDRRRAPRASIAATCSAVLPVAWAVQLLDISTKGVCVASPHDLPIGARALLRAVLGSTPFAAEIEVRRVAVVPAADQRERFRVAGVFVRLDDASHRAIEQLLTESPRRAQQRS